MVDDTRGIAFGFLISDGDRGVEYGYFSMPQTDPFHD